MTTILDPFTYPNLLWHSSASANREKILGAGLRPRGAVRWYQLKRPVWFYNSPGHYCAASENREASEAHGFLCAVEWDGAELGVDFSFESPHVVTVYRHVPPMEILGDFPCERVTDLESLAEVVADILGPDWAEEVAFRCSDADRSWVHSTSLAWTLLSLQPSVYRSAQLSQRLFSESLQGYTGSIDLVEILDRCDPRFKSSFEAHYYAAYEFPHFARALFVAGVRSKRSDTLVALLEGDRPVLQDSGDEFIATAYERLSVEDIGFAVFETLCARKVRFSDDARAKMLQWLEEHCEASEEWAFYMVRFAHSNFLARVGERGLDAAIRVLRKTGRDHIPTLLQLAESDYPPTHFGICDALGAFPDERAIPYLSGCLSHEERNWRAAAVSALGEIGTAEAVELIRPALSDPTSQVKKAARAALRR
jgi:hypothetical protein